MPSTQRVLRLGVLVTLPLALAWHAPRASLLYSTAEGAGDPTEAVSVRLRKPLGLILEETDSVGEAAGVFVAELAPDGAAARDGRVTEGMRLLAVEGTDVARASFDEAMGMLMEAADELELVFAMVGKPEALGEGEDASVVGAAAEGVQTETAQEEKEEPRDEGPLEVRMQGGGRVLVEQGEILRTALLQAKQDVYDLRGKVTNCNGAGQCGTCAVEVMSASEGALSERTDAEGKRLKSKPAQWRLSCQTVVEGAGTMELRLKPWKA